MNDNPKRVVVLGSTGSIGTQTLDVCRWRGYRVVGLVAGKNLELLTQQIAEFRPEVVAADPSILPELESRFPGLRTADALEVAAWPAEVVVGAIPGLAGLPGVRAAVQQGRRLALANKESMVAAGPLLWQEAEQSGAEIIPVDSEHSALFQSLLGEPLDDVAELILTASGGPFLREPADLSSVTPQMALQHPRWKMGPKVTIDSSTLFNKGLEVLEAVQLFKVPIEKVKVQIHPQSYVHSMVRFQDGNLKAQLGPTDMRLAIQYALTHPQRPPSPLREAPIPERLEFYPPDTRRFPALALAYEAGRMGGLAPVVLNAADEIAVEAFLQGQIGYLEIPRVLEKVLQQTPAGALTWDNIAYADLEARRWAREYLKVKV
ncbi:1-deoxy-D-xylulose-5-phosphate reductoisomerase [Meiothermus ruber]|jgi:1-deoxy-D-xylulose-5-phosphate reductoisomerase|uniref:1-deoxy-D-xylulose 5-phosphate reductoisomerase n=1 Tax=Meiothermus ruber (strain ATCC 35948 / DSM 1279 / VKM B-1258 / 21) TaxID=504728 RepID=D3PSW2_MEIRD|nr:1-deoxy-D-xylulose-5-phosphate reductoisomerase [Meiothermus ruber]ADD28545.1 1-deoxy-D-xylulose 5-phosphate reductoisomerase [Meiothermus ruber DSM 1279]AGK06012.1 1-deoxy-D-xylulose 5-phosphate reductoisomerase [Meiothermus ruber DSM 1279]MCL6530738.1 1-deoxy-D-xylulose-5-phosphate reductoisomerase [Meiothermus ruber]GAO75506.1 1-deoxy-D-xylulose 5-phosphate reductoisomerase [Meiothermus ruber H328]